MFGDGSLALREFLMREPHPLAEIQDAIFEFLRGRADAALHGAQAVNAYVDEARMTQDVDILSTRGPELAEELRSFLAERFHIAARVREAREGIGWRVYQVQQPRNRHLADVRQVESLPPRRLVQGVWVLAPEDLIAAKVRACVARRGHPKEFTDRRDLAVLLLAFPDLKAERGPVRERLAAMGSGPGDFAAWSEIVERELSPEDDDAEFS